MLNIAYNPYLFNCISLQRVIPHSGVNRQEVLVDEMSILTGGKKFKQLKTL